MRLVGNPGNPAVILFSYSVGCWPVTSEFMQTAFCRVPTSCCYCIHNKMIMLLLMIGLIQDIVSIPHQLLWPSIVADYVWESLQVFLVHAPPKTHFVVSPYYRCLIMQARYVAKRCCHSPIIIMRCSSYNVLSISIQESI